MNTDTKNNNNNTIEIQMKLLELAFFITAQLLV